VHRAFVFYLGLGLLVDRGSVKKSKESELLRLLASPTLTLTFCLPRRMLGSTDRSAPRPHLFTLF
jgi:hypothetical protein